MTDRTEYFKAYRKKKYAQLKVAGLCTMCGKDRPTVFAIRCNACEERHRESGRKCVPVKYPEKVRTRIFQDGQGAFV